MQTSRDTVRARGSETTPRRLLGRSSAASARVGLFRRLLGLLSICCTALANPIAALAEIEAGVESVEGIERRVDASTVQRTDNRPKVDLGRLLRLPDSYRQSSGNRRGVKRAEWENRFEIVRLDLSSSVQALAKAQSDLAEAADGSSAWAVAAPGATPNPENTPLSYKLRQEIRRQRELIERSERKLRSLEIEADLADVPQQWRATAIAAQPLR